MGDATAVGGVLEYKQDRGVLRWEHLQQSRDILVLCSMLRAVTVYGAEYISTGGAKLQHTRTAQNPPPADTPNFGSANTCAIDSSITWSKIKVK
jgi:hypothetical protein